MIVSCPRIGAGGTFKALADRLGAVELVENRRQALAWEREALHALRSGKVEVALAAYHVNDRRHTGCDVTSVSERLVADWARARSEGTEAMMLATTRADVDRLNDARDHLRQAGELGADVLHAAGRSFAEGDLVICGRNDARLGVINGARGTVWGLTPDGQGVMLEAGDSRRVTLPGYYLADGQLSHAYATTIHKAQGITTERTFVLADEHLYREAGYVALSRGRAGNDVYTSAGPGPGDTDEHHQDREPSRDVLEAGLARSRAQQAATVSERLPGRCIAELETERRQLMEVSERSSGRDRVELLRRADQLEQLVEQRTKALGVWAADHPGAEHIAAIGPAPRQPERRAEWVRAAAEISAFQERNGITYQPNLTPESRMARFDHDRVRRTIREIEPGLDRTKEIGLQRHRDLGLGL